ncbi:anti-sigma factor family protein [Longitalea luteola]|uniref:anti-sigma factor family protein n=1 Tax=Longitalea luteola TaxID=2812563 RepID=UPI001A96212A|nr:hypothetical protein [Longitalea luteola]
MNKQQHIEERLWEYIDGAGSAEDRLFIEQLITTNQEWKTKYEELLQLQDMLSHLELDEPSMRFTQNIMESISKHHIAPAARSYINKRIIWGIAGFFICSIIVLLVACLTQVNWSAGSSVSSSAINFGKLSHVDPGRFINSTYTTLFMMINVVLGLVLLDRYLNFRKSKMESKRS